MTFSYISRDNVLNVLAVSVLAIRMKNISRQHNGQIQIDIKLILQHVNSEVWEYFSHTDFSSDETGPPLQTHSLRDFEKVGSVSGFVFCQLVGTNCFCCFYVECSCGDGASQTFETILLFSI